MEVAFLIRDLFHYHMIHVYLIVCILVFYAFLDDKNGKVVFLPTCIMLMSRSPLFHVQKETLSWYVNHVRACVTLNQIAMCVVVC